MDPPTLLRRLVFVVILASSISLGSTSDRWVWSRQREERQTPPPSPPVFPPFMPLILRRELGRQLALSSSSSGNGITSTNPHVSEAQPAEDEVVVPLSAGPRGVPQEALVVAPLPLDISKLPLESSPSESLLTVYAPNDHISLTSDADLTLPGEGRLIPLPLEPHNPSLQTKVGNVEALVATPDISQLPLEQPGFSATFLPSLNREVKVSGPQNTVPVAPRDAVVFPLKVKEHPTKRTTPAPSSTPVPTRIFLRDSASLDVTPFLGAERLQDERFDKTFEALQRDTLTNFYFNQAFHRLQELAEENNDLHGDGGEDDRMIFPKKISSSHSQSFKPKKSALTIVEPPQFGNVNNNHFLGFQGLFSLPVLQQPKVDIQAEAAPVDTNRLRVVASPLTTNTKSTLTMAFRESPAEREGRRVAPHVWLWPGETRGGPNHFNQPSFHAL